MIRTCVCPAYATPTYSLKSSGFIHLFLSNIGFELLIRQILFLSKQHIKKKFTGLVETQDYSIAHLHASDGVI